MLLYILNTSHRWMRWLLNETTCLLKHVDILKARQLVILEARQLVKLIFGRHVSWLYWKVKCMLGTISSWYFLCLIYLDQHDLFRLIYNLFPRLIPFIFCISPRLYTGQWPLKKQTCPNTRMLPKGGTSRRPLLFNRYLIGTIVPPKT